MTTRIDLLKEVSRNLGDLLLDGVPASLTASTVDHLSLVQRNSEDLTAKNFYVYSGAGAGQNRVVGSFNVANHRLIFEQGFGSIPSVNSNFILSDKFDKDQVDNAVGHFVQLARQRFLQDKTATLSIVGTQYEYATPSGMDYINTLRLIPTTNSDYGASDEVDTVFEFPTRYWRIERNSGGSYVIAFDARRIDIANYDGQLINIIGQAKPDIQGTDNASIPEELERYIVTGATAHLSALKIRDGEQWKQLFYTYRDENKSLEDYIFRYGHGRKVGG